MNSSKLYLLNEGTGPRTGTTVYVGFLPPHRAFRGRPTRRSDSGLRASSKLLGRLYDAEPAGFFCPSWPSNNHLSRRSSSVALMEFCFSCDYAGNWRMTVRTTFLPRADLFGGNILHHSSVIDGFTAVCLLSILLLETGKVACAVGGLSLWECFCVFSNLGVSHAEMAWEL